MRPKTLKYRLTLICIFSLLSVSGIQAQQDSIYTYPEKLPEFPGGVNQMFTFIATHTKYPGQALEKNIEGRVMVSMIIDKDGNIKNPAIYKSVNPLLDSESIRMVNEMPKWTPGMQNGKLVSTRYFLPVTFRIDKSKSAIDTTQHNDKFPEPTFNLLNYLCDNIKFPAEAERDRVEGRIIVRFLIDRSGKIKDPLIISPLYPLLDAEVLRVIKGMPMWTPGERDGKKSNAYYVMPLDFKLRYPGAVVNTMSGRKLLVDDNPFAARAYLSIQFKPELGKFSWFE